MRKEKEVCLFVCLLFIFFISFHYLPPSLLPPSPLITSVLASLSPATSLNFTLREVLGLYILAGFFPVWKRPPISPVRGRGGGREGDERGEERGKKEKKGEKKGEKKPPGPFFPKAIVVKATKESKRRPWKMLTQECSVISR